MNKLIITILASVLLLGVVAVCIQQGIFFSPHNRPDALKLIALLKEENYAKLNTMISARSAAYKKDLTEEANFALVMFSLGNNDPSHEALMTEWIAQYPDSYIPYLVRGSYYIKLGYAWRGTGSSAKTSDEQSAKYHFYHDKAYLDLRQSIELEPTAQAYSELISLSSRALQGETRQGLFARGLSILPGSYELRKAYLHKLTPRWGGSYEQINEVLRDIHQHLEANPALKPLLAYMHYEKTYKLKREGSYRAAINQMDKALGYGEKSWYFTERGVSYFLLKDYENALLDFNRALQNYPHSASALEWRASIYVKLERYEEAMDDLDLAAKLEPYNSRVHYERGNLHNKLKQYAEAVADYRKVLHYEARDTELRYFMGGLLHRKLKLHKEAAEALKITTEQDPDNPRYWYRYSLALDSSYDCEVIPSLDKYLSICQNHRDNICDNKYKDWANEVSDSLISHNKCPAMDNKAEEQAEAEQADSKFDIEGI